MIIFTQNWWLVLTKTKVLGGGDVHVTGRLFYEREVVTPYIHFTSDIMYSVFINAAKVDAGCSRGVKLLQAWRNVNKRFSFCKQPKYRSNIE